ncbi:membrane bound O-acyl transferase family-domain-containing protein [Mycena maculata]|uniref:Membrane bound O-acyl transferase family-domain-containing protein n=1 Tax=Mycena maculata TaxID=230809 RepID=A0AAD7J855_9AGAR|nr:membrane bound O-acyl transferase family-domain-containing protein [Mycena maculata]
MTLSNLFSWKPFPYAYLAVYLTILITGLATRPSPYRRLFFVPLIALTWRLLRDSEAGYITSMFWLSCLIMGSDYILLTDVQRELRQLPDSTDRRAATSKSQQYIESAPLTWRLKWALHLFLDVRGVGWAHEPRAALPGSRAPPNTSRITFLVSQTARMLATILLFDLVNLHTRWNPAFGQRMGLEAVDWPWRVVGTVGWAAGAYAGLALPHQAASIVCVAIGVSLPQDWPPLFGGLADAASVRTFWARCWHQLLRRSLSAHGKFVSSTLLRLPPGTASTCVQIVIAFILSGVVHYLGESVPLRPRRERSGSLIFFGIQPLGIAAEVLVAHLARRVGVRGSRAIGCAWVFAWFVLTLPIMQDPLIRAGEMDSRVDVSLIMRIWRGTWDLPPVGVA